MLDPVLVLEWLGAFLLLQINIAFLLRYVVAPAREAVKQHQERHVVAIESVADLSAHWKDSLDATG